jgi:hypothetical protein
MSVDTLIVLILLIPFFLFLWMLTANLIGALRYKAWSLFWANLGILCFCLGIMLMVFDRRFGPDALALGMVGLVWVHLFRRRVSSDLRRHNITPRQLLRFWKLPR